MFDARQHVYNDAFGKYQGIVNMGSVPPPQTKGSAPHIFKDRLSELQDMCDRLEADEVLARPEVANMVVEYLSPFFLVKKESGGFRLVTEFGEIVKHCLPKPGLMPNTDSVLKQIAQ